MQNKGALKFLAIALAIACAYQLSFTFVTRHVEKKAAEYAAGDAVKEQNYLDSIKSQTVYNLGFVKFNYKECKEKEINLGLDLRGGMNVMLEISVEDVVRALSNDSKDPAFNQALKEATEAQKNSTSDYITLFAEAYERISNGGRLSYVFNTPELREQITPNSSNADVIKVLRKSADGAIENSFNVLRNRIDRFGVTQPNIQRLENSGRILVELPGVKEPERVRKLLQGTASLEFWATYNNTEIYPLLMEANQVIKDLQDAGQIAGDDTIAREVAAVDSLVSRQAVSDSTSLLSALDSLGHPAEAEDDAALAAQYPLFSKLTPVADQQGRVGDGPVIGQALSFDTATVNRYLNLPQVKALLPRDLKLMWGIKPVDVQETVFQLYAIKANTRDGKAPLDGGAVVSAHEGYAQHGSSAVVSMTMNAAGARTWARMTADNIGQCIAIVLDGYVYSAPVVNQEITGGQSEISGHFTITEARDLANVLESAQLARSGAHHAGYGRRSFARTGVDQFGYVVVHSGIRARASLYDLLLQQGRYGCQHRTDMQPVLPVRRARLVRSRADAARYRRYRSDDGYGRRRQRDHLRASQGGAAYGQDAERFGGRRIQECHVGHHRR